MQLIISLLVYNQLDVTKKCIQSILENSTSDYQLIISDNASRKDTQDYLSKLKDKRIKYVRNKENLGFIKAHNNIFNQTQAKYFCVLNNDLIIKTKGWDNQLINLLESNQGLAQIGNKQEFGYIGDEGKGQPRKGNPIDYIEGSCFIVNRDYVNNVGGLFEEKYMTFAFCEDADLSLRLRSAGYKIAECQDINILHFHHQSFKHEKVEIDFKKHEQENNYFLRTRWKKYLKTRKFEPMKILIDRQGAIGDTLLVEPVIRGLKEKYPQCQIFVNTVCPQPFLNNPYITEYGKSLKHKLQYDLMIDLNMAYEKRPELHVIDAYCKTANITLTPEEKIPRYYGFDKSTVQKAKNTLVVCSDNTWKNRMISLATWKKFIQYLKNEKKYYIVEVGINPENYLGVGLNLIGKIPFNETVKVIYQAEMFLSWDSGLMHFAQAMETPIFAFFGCINPQYRIHDWDKATVVWLNDLECAGCHHKLPAPRTFTECNKDKIYCCENITIDLLIDKFEHRKNNGGI